MNSTHLARVRAGARRLAPAGLSLAAVLAVAACGSSSSLHTRRGSGLSATAVADVQTNVTAQMVPAARRPSSHTREAEFTLTATDRAGRPAAGQPVTFWIGPMFPRCDTPIKAWYEVGGQYARRFVASASTRTNAQGQATLKLLGQTPRTMEMVALRVGNLSSFNDGHGVGLLDAWWTRAGARPTAPVGDRVTVTPFLTAPAQSHTSFRVRVSHGAGRAVTGARVSLRANVMSARTRTAQATTVMQTTTRRGDTTFVYPHGAQGTLRIKVYRSDSEALFSGAMTAEIATQG